MNPLLVIWGVMTVMGAIYWWQQKVIAYAGDGSLSYSFTCLVTGGMNSCPVSGLITLQQDNWFATGLFYVGVGIFLFPPPPPPEPLR
jgi:hypothetical protein